MFTLDNIISLAKLQFKLDVDSLHGLDHWLTVMNTAQKIAQTNGADYQVVTLFSIFHDCCRLTDKEDPEHGIESIFIFSSKW
jgi:HD superfamily phosphodiesterase